MQDGRRDLDENVNDTAMTNSFDSDSLANSS